MNYLFLICIFFAHWLLDFVFQIQGEKKHDNWRILLHHTGTYSVGMANMFAIGCMIFGFPIDGLTYISFMGITFFSHTLIDYFTSKWNHKQLVAKRYKLWINSLGFDQFLHHAQLLLTIWMLR